MNALNIITAVCSVLFIMIGIDKFSPFMDPPCAMMENISPFLWKILGILQLAAGILIWVQDVKRYVAGFFTLFMIFFIIYHLTQDTYDVGGAIFMAILLGILVWNPAFLGGKSRQGRSGA